MQTASTFTKRAPRVGRSTLAWTTAAIIASNWALIAEATPNFGDHVQVDEHQRNLLETEMAAYLDVVDLKHIIFTEDQNDDVSDKKDGNEVASQGDLSVKSSDDSSDDENALEVQDETETDSVSSLSPSSSDESSLDESSSDEDGLRHLRSTKQPKRSQIWRGYDRLEAKFEALKAQNEELETQVSTMTSPTEKTNLGPELDFFWKNDSDKIIQPAGLALAGGLSSGPSSAPMLDGNDINGGFCVEGNKVLAFQAQCVIGNEIVDEGDNTVTMYLTKDGSAAGGGEQLATSTRKQKGKTQSMSLFYKGLVEEPAEFQLYILNSFDAPITLKAKECQIGFQIYNGNDYPLSEAVPSCE